jgi:Transmembrane amino acid transporter protein
MRGLTKPTDKQRTAWTVGLLSLVSTLSLFLKDLGFVNSFGGALIASGIIYVFPALMFLAPLRRKVIAETHTKVHYECVIVK